MPDRRPLTFDRLDQVMPEVDRLLKGHETTGNWSLAQICNHLALVFQLSIEGYGFSIPWVLRALIGPLARREVFGKGTLRPGLKIPDRFVPKPGLDARAEAEALRAAIAYYETHPETRAPHPLLGPLSNERWDRLHCIHCAHHLSFALPTEVASPA